MDLFDAEAVHEALAYGVLVDRLRTAFAGDAEVPVRHHHTIELADQPDATLLLMPAWRSGGHVAVKVVSVFPGNADRGMPAVTGQVLLLDGETGVPLAMVDGTALTVRRTACASALAASYLAREDAATLLMVGAGAMAPHLVGAHAAVRPIERVRIWNRTPANAEKLAADLERDGFDAAVVDDLAGAAAEADIISCATLSHDPIIKGDWLRPGVHVDLVGAFRPEMRETDDTAVAKARVFVDTRAGALQEGGDIVQPLATGVIDEAHILGELAELARGSVVGRSSADDITLFKSVGTALEDLTAAELVAEAGST